MSLRERDRAWAGEGQRERETQNLKQAPGSELSAQSPTRGSNPRTVRSWPEPKPDAQPTEPPKRPSSPSLKPAIISWVLLTMPTLWSCFCQHRVWHRAQTHEPWDHDLSRSQTLTHWATQAPLDNSNFIQTRPELSRRGNALQLIVHGCCNF